MTQDKELLRKTWTELRDNTAWLSKMVEGLGLDSEDEAYLNDLEDNLISTRHLQHKSEARTKSLVDDFKAEMESENPGYADDCRRRYLIQEIARIKEDISAERLIWGKAAANAKTKDEGDFAVAMSTDPAKVKELSKLQNELAFLGKPPREGRLSDQEIQRAKDYPLWKLLDRQPKDTVKCIFHDDKKKHVTLYPVNGYCFVCNKPFSAINWLQKTQGLTFIEAVRKLL